jgi:predicted nucleic acid-binding protein
VTMRTIPDSNVILDAIGASIEWRDWSERHLKTCATQGGLIINTIVYAEAASQIADRSMYDAILAAIECEREDVPWEAAFVAGHAHRKYRKAGGIRARVLPDFLIGAHALVKGYSLLTRDATRYRSYFPALDIIAPDTHQ